jgi:hypothetical protein
VVVSLNQNAAQTVGPAGIVRSNRQAAKAKPLEWTGMKRCTCVDCIRCGRAKEWRLVFCGAPLCAMRFAKSWKIGRHCNGQARRFCVGTQSITITTSSDSTCYPISHIVELFAWAAHDAFRLAARRGFCQLTELPFHFLKGFKLHLSMPRFAAADVEPRQSQERVQPRALKTTMTKGDAHLSRRRGPATRN